MARQTVEVEIPDLKNILNAAVRIHQRKQVLRIDVRGTKEVRDEINFDAPATR